MRASPPADRSARRATARCACKFPRVGLPASTLGVFRDHRKQGRRCASHGAGRVDGPGMRTFGELEVSRHVVVETCLRSLAGIAPGAFVWPRFIWPRARLYRSAPAAAGNLSVVREVVSVGRCLGAPILLFAVVSLEVLGVGTRPFLKGPGGRSGELLD